MYVGMSLIKMNGISSFAWWIFRFSCIFAIFALICALGNPQNGYTNSVFYARKKFL